MKKRAFALLVALMCLAGGPPACAGGPSGPLEPTAPAWTAYDPALHYYYWQLTDPEKRAFSGRYDSIALGDAARWDDCGLDAAGLARVDYALLTDCPELMYMPTSTGAAGELLPPDADYCARHPGEIEAMLADCRAAFGEMARRPEWDETDYGRQLAADRFIAGRCRYAVEQDFGGAAYAPDPALRTAHAALAGGEATCVGYAQGVQLALRCLDIPCLMVYGYVRDGEGRSVPHAWNMAEIDGAWYHHDATWDDRLDEAFLEDYLPYFNLSSAEIGRSHADDPARPALGFSLPACEDTRANYYAVEGRMLDGGWREALPRLLQTAREEGRGRAQREISGAD